MTATHRNAVAAAVPLRARAAALLAMIALAALASTADAQIRAGDVTALKGEAAAENQNAKRALATGAAVFVDEMVTTGAASRMTLSLGKATIIKLGENVRMKIDRHLV